MMYSKTHKSCTTIRFSIYDRHAFEIDPDAGGSYYDPNNV